MSDNNTESRKQPSQVLYNSFTAGIISVLVSFFLSAFVTCSWYHLMKTPGVFQTIYCTYCFPWSLKKNIIYVEIIARVEAHYLSQRADYSFSSAGMPDSNIFIFSFSFLPISGHALYMRSIFLLLWSFFLLFPWQEYRCTHLYSLTFSQHLNYSNHLHSTPFPNLPAVLPRIWCHFKVH